MAPRFVPVHELFGFPKIVFTDSTLLNDLIGECHERNVPYDNVQTVQGIELDLVLAWIDSVSFQARILTSPYLELAECSTLSIKLLTSSYDEERDLVAKLAKKPIYWQFIPMVDRIVWARVRQTSGLGELDIKEPYQHFSIKSWNIEHGYCTLLMLVRNSEPFGCKC